MGSDQGQLDAIYGKVKETWGDLTDDDIARIEGSQEQLVGRIQERYGIAKEEAQKQVDAWLEEQL